MTRKAEATYHFVEVSTTGSALKIVAHRLDGTVLDRCGFGKEAPWDCDRPRSAPDAGLTPSLPPVPDAPQAHGASTHCACDVPGMRTFGASSAILLGAGFVAGRVRRRGSVTRFCREATASRKG